jgi:SAM-dependent methyltransferase
VADLGATEAVRASTIGFARRATRAAAAWLEKARWRFAYRSIAERFWERQAAEIHERWGRTKDDFGVVAEVLDSVGAGSVLDVGCGSGRLFPLYLERRMERIVGVDISVGALELARRDFPTVDLRQVSVLDLSPTTVGQFDLALTNRVLQHIPRPEVGRAVGAICSVADYVYVNELGRTDVIPETFTMVRHDYPVLFGDRGFDLVRTGVVGHQTFQLFHRRGA